MTKERRDFLRRRGSNGGPWGPEGHEGHGPHGPREHEGPRRQGAPPPPEHSEDSL
jgi:hypothetical protein